MSNAPIDSIDPLVEHKDSLSKSESISSASLKSLSTSSVGVAPSIPTPSEPIASAASSQLSDGTRGAVTAIPTAPAAAFKPVSSVLLGDAEQKQRSLKYSVVDGSFYAMMAGFGESFFSAFAIFLNANAGQLALLGSVPQMIGSFSQLLTRRCVKLFGSKKRFVVTFATAQALMHLVVLCAYLFKAISVPFLICAVSLYYLCGLIISPAWNAWMGDLVDEKMRGTYFGRRNFACGFASFFALLTAGYLLQSYTDTPGEKFLGFVFLFVIAVCARLVSAYFLAQQYEPKTIVHDRNQFPLRDFVHALRTTNLGTFLAFMWLFNFGVYLSSPFFAPYMLGQLGLSYIQYTMINAAAIIAKLLFMPIWGKASDRFGTRKLMLLSACLVVLVPFSWLFGSSVIYLIIIQLYSGFAWAGLELTSFNFLFDATSPKQRSSVIAYYNVINGIMLFCGALIGGWLVTIGLIPGWSIYFGVFLASGVFRLIACTFFLSRVKEVRQFEAVGYRHLLFHELTVQPTLGLVHGAVEATNWTRRRVTSRVTHLFTDIDDFLDNISGHHRIQRHIASHISSFFVEVDKFIDRHKKKQK